MKQIPESPPILTKIIIMIIAFICGLIFVFYIRWWEFFFLDLKFLLAHYNTTGNPVSHEIALILLDDDSRKRLHISSPGSSVREYHSRVVKLLTQAGARVIIFDIEFLTPDKVWDPLFAEECRAAGNVIAVESNGAGIIKTIKESLFTTGNPGIKTFWGVPRQVYHYPAQRRQPALSVAAALYFLKTQPQKDTEKIKNISSIESFWINYKHPPSFFPVFSYADVLETTHGRIGDTRKTPLSFFTDRIVLIDYISAEFPVPNITGQKLPGVYAHTYAVHNLVNSSYIHPEHCYSIIILLISLLLVQSMLFIKNRLYRIPCLFIFFILLFYLEYMLFIAFDLWVVYAPIIISSFLLIICNRVYIRFVFQKEYKTLACRMDKLEQLLKQIKDTEKKKGGLMASLVHDIKNHASSIDAGIVLLHRKYDPIPGAVKNLDFMKTACTDIITLSSNLMDITRMEEGTLQVNKTIIDYSFLSGLFTKCVYHPAFTVKNIKVTIKSPSGSFIIKADHTLLERIIRNLVSNAAKYTDRNGQIITSCITQERENIISIFNTAPPIPADKREFIFDKYSRIDSTSSFYSKGLGLYFCRMVMQAHGGRIWVESDEQGNYFKLGFRE